jgi:hypothetical protein
MAVAIVHVAASKAMRTRFTRRSARNRDQSSPAELRHEATALNVAKDMAQLVRRLDRYLQSVTRLPAQTLQERATVRRLLLLVSVETNTGAVRTSGPSATETLKSYQDGVVRALLRVRAISSLPLAITLAAQSHGVRAMTRRGTAAGAPRSPPTSRDT